MQITITKPALFAAAARFMSTEAARYYLNGVHIEPGPDGGAILVAIDGHRMFVAHDQDATLDLDGMASVTIKPAKPKMPVAYFQKGNGPLVLDGKSATLETSKGLDISTAPIVEGMEFPDWRRVVPASSTRLELDMNGITFEGSYVFDFGDVAKKLGGKYQLYPNGADAALVSLGRDDCFGVIMPIRATKGIMKVPHWIHARPDTAVAA